MLIPYYLKKIVLNDLYLNKNSCYPRLLHCPSVYNLLRVSQNRSIVCNDNGKYISAFCGHVRADHFQ